MQNNLSKEPFIICPYCGAKYMPSEIFIEKGLLGDAHNIVKTSTGEIEHYLGKPYDLHETFVCDYCNKEFEVEGVMSFTTKEVEDFDEDYEKPLYTDRIQLEEN